MATDLLSPATDFHEKLITVLQWHAGSSLLSLPNGFVKASLLYNIGTIVISSTVSPTIATIVV